MTEKKRLERVERRRPLVEVNLISERAKARPGRRGIRGCGLPFGAFVIVLTAVATAVVVLR